MGIESTYYVTRGNAKKMLRQKGMRVNRDAQNGTLEGLLHFCAEVDRRRFEVVDSIPAGTDKDRIKTGWQDNGNSNRL